MAELNEKIVTITREVLENHAFMFSSVAGEGESDLADEELIAGSIGFRELDGDAQNQIEILVTNDFAYEYVENALGLEPDELDDDIVYDALGELLNLVAGHLSSQLTGDDAIRLEIPRVGAAIGASTEVSQFGISLLVDDHPVLVRIRQADELPRQER